MMRTAESGGCRCETSPKDPRPIMSKETQISESGGQVFECPYDNNHRVDFPRMEKHLTECRQLAPVSEKTVCPFNEQHVVYAPEIDYHKAICPQKPPKSDDIECNGENSGVCEEQIENESSEPTGKTPSKTEKLSFVGCVGGQSVGGRGNHIPVFEQEDDTDKKSSSVDQAEQLNGKSSGNDSADTMIQEPLTHKTAIEKQLSQSDSDTAETDASVSGESDQERFDYLKYKPSNEVREEFLRLIKQQKATEACEEKQAAVDQHAYQAAMWGQPYGYMSGQYPAYPTAYFPFPNCYPMMTAMPTQHPYATGYFAPSMLPPPGTGFVHGAYECGHIGRPQHHFKRRNYPNHRHSRYNSNRFHYNDSHNHGDTDSNSSSQSDAGLSDDSTATQSISNGTNGKHTSSDKTALKQSNGRAHKKSSPTCSATGGQNGVIKHFVDIGKVQEREANGDLSDSSQEKEMMEDKLGSQRKSEQQKQMRKLKKKITEIIQLEEKRSEGATLDCDQLKKLSRKKDFEVELQYLSQGNLGN